MDTNRMAHRGNPGRHGNGLIIELWCISAPRAKVITVGVSDKKHWRAKTEGHSGMATLGTGPIFEARAL